MDKSCWRLAGFLYYCLIRRQITISEGILIGSASGCTGNKINQNHLSDDLRSKNSKWMGGCIVIVNFSYSDCIYWMHNFLHEITVGRFNNYIMYQLTLKEYNGK